MGKTELIICTEKGYLESLSKLLIFSLRTFGGKYKDIPIFSYQPRKHLPVSASTISFFEKHEVEFIDLELNKEYPDYPYGNKPLACGHREKNSNADTIIFMDSDILFLNEPGEFNNFGNADVILRPVDNKNAGTSIDLNDSNYPYWESLYKLLDVKIRREVNTTVDNQKILEYYNAGLIISKSSNYLYSNWEANFIKTMKAGLSPDRGITFSDQTTLAATISQLKLNVKLADKHHNYPIHLLDRMKNNSFRVDDHKKLVTVHYHNIFKNQDLSNPIEGILDETSNGRILNQKLREFNVIRKKHKPFVTRLINFLNKKMKG